MTRLIQAPTVLTVLNVPQSVTFLDTQSLDHMYSLSILYINGNIKKYTKTSIDTCKSLKIIYYSGRANVGTILSNASPQVIACSEYKGEFSGIAVEKNGECMKRVKSCDFKRNSSKNLLPIYLIYVALS